jgi:hypothetical protein
MFMIIKMKEEKQVNQNKQMISAQIGIYCIYVNVRCDGTIKHHLKHGRSPHNHAYSYVCSVYEFT